MRARLVVARRTVGGLGQEGNPLTYTASLGIAERLPGCDLPTLLISGYSADTVPGSGLPERTRLLRKPFTTAALLRAVDEILHRAPRGS